MSLAELLSHIFIKCMSATLGICFILSGISINLLQFLAYTFIKPFSGDLFRKCNGSLTYMLNSQIVFFLQHWGDVNVTLHATKSDHEYFGKEQAVVLMNHRYEIDWMLGCVLCDFFRILGNSQSVTKKSVQYVPTLGYSWKMGGAVFVERNWEKDQEVIEKKLREMMEQKEPFWLFLAAEGTRFSEEKKLESNAFARKKGIRELQYHLIPRTKGFAISIPVIRNKMAAIYNVNMGFKPDAVKPTLTNILLGKSIKADVYVERFPMKELPESEDDLAAWLHSVFRRKDELIHSYLTTGHWKAVPNPKEYKSLYMQKRLAPLVNFTFWYAVVVVPLGIFLFRLLMTGSFFNVVTVFGIIGFFVYLFDRLAGETKISRSSSYGTS